MTHRIPLDHLTSDQYDALCNELAALRAVARGYCPACGRGDAAPTVTDWEQQKQHAERAEAAIARLRNLHREEYGSRAECDHEVSVPWPCPTIRTLNGEQP